MSVAKFDGLLEILSPRHKNTNYQAAISPEQRLVLTLRYVCFPCCIIDNTCNKELQTLFAFSLLRLQKKKKFKK